MSLKAKTRERVQPKMERSILTTEAYPPTVPRAEVASSCTRGDITWNRQQPDLQQCRNVVGWH